MSSDLETALLFQLRALRLPEPVREFRFDPVRRWRFDFCWPSVRLAVEVEGAIWSNGRHSRGAGFTADCSKYNAAALQGWRVLRFTVDMIASGEALQAVESALRQDKDAT